MLPTATVAYVPFPPTPGEMVAEGRMKGLTFVQHCDQENVEFPLALAT